MRNWPAERFTGRGDDLCHCHRRRRHIEYLVTACRSIQHAEAGLRMFLLIDETLSIFSATRPDKASSIESANQFCDITAIAFTVDRGKSQNRERARYVGCPLNCS